MAHSVLLVDDERFARTVYSDYLRNSGYELEVAQDAGAAVDLLRSRRFDVMVTDMILPGMDGLELLGIAKQIDPNIEVVVITALDRVDPAVRAMRSGASDYLVKPVSPEALQISVQRCLSTRTLLAENKALRAHLRLFETCQRITATLEREKLVPLSLGAISAECACAGAVLLERDARGEWTFAGVSNVEPEVGPVVLSAALEQLGRLGYEGSLPVELPDQLGPAVLLPVTDGKEVLAAAALLASGAAGRPAPASWPPLQEQIVSAGFVCKHLGLALRNLSRLKQVEHLAYLDDLTHLYNTRYLELTLEREINGGRPFSVLFLDLVFFKNVNVQHGHLVGSRLLVEVARVLRSCVRDEDVLVRYGGDEYVAVLVGIDSGSALKVAERIRRAIEDHRFLAREKALVRVTASIGLASYPEHATVKSEILDLADRAMYRGKRTTRNVVYMAAKDLPPVPGR